VPRDGELGAGLAVTIARLGDGVVLGPPDKGKVNVRIGALRSTVDVADVRVLDVADLKAKPRANDPVRTRAGGARWGEARPASPGEGGREGPPGDDGGYARTVDGTLDLRGERVDAALARIDKFVDDALLSEREVLCLLHGHGTGVLRQAVREHCGAHPAITKMRPGTPPEGGDGVTLLWLS
jgi:DNA mismatch repair protein MutS2